MKRNVAKSISFPHQRALQQVIKRFIKNLMYNGVRLFCNPMFSKEKVSEEAI